MGSSRHLLLEIKALLSVPNEGDKRVHIRIACNGTRKSPTWSFTVQRPSITSRRQARCSIKRVTFLLESFYG